MITDSPFCEYYQQGRYLPEWTNCVSSMVFCFTAFFLYFFSSTSSIRTGRLLLIALLFTGISSTLFHYNLWQIFGNMDVVSVLFLSHIGSYVISEAIGASHIKEITYISLCTTISLWFAPNYNPFQLYVLVIVPQIHVLSIIIYCNICYFLKYRNFKMRSIIYMDIGTVILLLSACIPIFLDPNCLTSYIRTHAIWHIGSSYGIHLLTQAFFEIRSNDKPVIYRCDYPIFLILPCVINSNF